MGRQIQHFLSELDEERLIRHLELKFRARVADAVYPATWDHRTLERTRDAKTWIIADERAVSLLLDSATRLDAAHPVQSRGWRISSRAFSCIEWERGERGRLYVSTTPDPIWADVSAATGDDVERAYARACRWIRAHCVDERDSKRGVWVSRELVPSYRRMREDAEARRRARPKDPRDDRFYALKRKPKRRLTADDKASLARYCELMIAWLGDDVAAASWRAYRDELLATHLRNGTGA